jgi:hypothetical protein
MANTKGTDKAMEPRSRPGRDPTVDELAAGKDKGAPSLDQRIRRDQDSPASRVSDEDE